MSFAPDELAKGEVYYNYALDRSPRTPNGPASACSTRTWTARVYHTYSTYARGLDMMNGAYHYLDLVPKGRDEAGLRSHHGLGALHDSYED